MKCKIAILVGLIGLAAVAPCKTAAAMQQIGALQGGARFKSFESDGTKSIAVNNAGSASARQSAPTQLEFYGPNGQIERIATGYQSLEVSGGKAVGIAHLAGPSGSQFTFTDEWTIGATTLRLSRTVQVSGTSSSGFLSAITLSHPEAHSRSTVDYFAPGIIYGSTAHLSAAAIGGSLTYENGGLGQVRIREDRLPAPLFGVRFEDGTALTILDAAPKGETTTADSHDTEVNAMQDERFRFGAIGVDLDDGHHRRAFGFPAAREK